MLIYQIVFMTRTSASRDWNHLHSTKFSLPSIQRYVLHNISESDIAKALQHPDRGELRLPSTFKQMNSPYNSQQQRDTSFIQAGSCDKKPLRLSPYWQVFGIDFSHAKSSQSIPSADVLAVHYDSHKSVDELVDQALFSGKKALVYIVPAGWVPNFGLKIYKIPVFAALEYPNICQSLVLDFEGGSFVSWRPFQWVIPGFSYEKIIIGDSRGSSESTAAFLEVARVFQRLSSLGWKPLRTIQFVSFPRYGAKEFARKFRSSLQGRGVVYLDSSELDASNRVSASPTLLKVSDWAVKQLLEGGLISQRHFEQVFSAGVGSNTFLFDLQISSISVGMATPVNQARILALLLATISQDAILPLSIKEYASFLPEFTHFKQIASRVDAHIESLRESFTREHPWYELTAKIKILSQRKRVNLVMSQIERYFVNGKAKHSLFASDISGTRTIINRHQQELAIVVSEVSKKLQQLL